jgi:valine--pyruvate aminotransferase
MVAAEGIQVRISKFGQRFSGGTGTRQLMDDLGAVSASDTAMLNLGGGNPSFIAPVHAVFRERMRRMLADGSFDAAVSKYDGPQGNRDFLKAIARMLRDKYGWSLTDENVATTAGSQAGFFMLFNLFAGSFEDGATRRILLPLAPEYIGYSDLGLEADLLVSNRPKIEYIDEHTFKYHIDFDKLSIPDDIGAVCVTRPTNPTGNVLTRQEMERLLVLTARSNVLLMIDNAYGTPFPNIVFSEADPMWDQHVILCMSLSKLGLPGVRTGIVVANPDVIQALTSMNAVLMLANSGLGAAVTADLIESGEIARLSERHIRPYYTERSKQAIAWCHRDFSGMDYYLHKSEGAIFLWLWLRGLPISSQSLYERLKARGVLVLPGHYFFPGFNEPWDHKDECLRISYAQDPAVVEKGIGIIAEEVRKAFEGHD